VTSIAPHEWLRPDIDKNWFRSHLTERELKHGAKIDYNSGQGQPFN